MASIPIRFERPQPRYSALPAFTEEMSRLAHFAPPFRFTSFFSPEDTLLCVLAAEDALRALVQKSDDAGSTSLRMVELTTGSGLVGLRLLELAPHASMFGIDIDPAAPPVARANADLMGFRDRTRFEQGTIWEPALERMLVSEPCDLLVCNPPYIPEPPGDSLPVEAGAGPDGSAHVRRVIEIADVSRPATLVLSWCSLCDPIGIVGDAARAGYELESMYVVAIADGEYSGGVHEYLRSLPTAFLNDTTHVVRQVAPDGAARFAYLLLAGVFQDVRSAKTTAERGNTASHASAVDHLMRTFVARGVDALIEPPAPFPVNCWLLDRWDEIALRVYLHGQ